MKKRGWMGFGLTLLILGITACGDDAPSGTALAVAGDDADVLLGTAASPDGSASTGVTSSNWTITSQPAGSSATLTNASTLTPAITPDVAGDYVLQLSVNDGASTDSVTLTGKAVIAAIGSSTLTTRTRLGVAENVVNLAQTGGVLSAAGSLGTIASYSWTQTSGPPATITSSDTTSATLEFTAPSLAAFLNPSDHFKWQVLPISRDDTKMIFALTVTDSSGNSDTETFTVFVADNGSEIHTASGLNNVGVNSKVYLAGADIKTKATSSAAAVNITGWTWTLTPAEGSSATFADSGTTTSTSQFPSFVPDVAGTYSVAYNATDGNGNTTASVPLAKTPGTILINAADYVGVGTIGGTTPENPQCGTCHDGSVQEDKVTEWSETKHGSIFETSITSYDSLAPEPFLWQYHTVGYNTDADNNGFDDLASAAGFTFPDTGLSYADFISEDPTVAKLANVQCESCHGPGSEHSGDPLRIDVSVSNAGVCGQCHIQEAEWKNSAKNSTASYATSTWITNKVCTKCHIGEGFLTYFDAGTTADGGFDTVAAQASEVALTNDPDSYGGVTCATCHDPHDATNDFHLREEGSVTMLDGNVVDAGLGGICYRCHTGNREIDEADCDADADGVADTACLTADQTALQYSGGGYHDTPQSTMLEGSQALNLSDGTAFPATENSFHQSDEFILADVTGDDSLSSTNNKCVTCHMAAGPSATEAGYQQVGGHTFKMVSDDGVENVAACNQCHSETAINETTGFNRLARADYDGDGTQEGIQSEVKGLLVALTTKIKAQDTVHINQNTDVTKTSATTGTSGTYVVSTATATEAVGDIHTGTLSINGATTTLTAATKCSTKTNAGIWTSTAATGNRPCNFNAMSSTLKRAFWNINSVVNDESFGIHNAAYTIQVLQGTYTNVGGNSFATDFPNATIR